MTAAGTARTAAAAMTGGEVAVGAGGCEEGLTEEREGPGPASSSTSTTSQNSSSTSTTAQQSSSSSASTSPSSSSTTTSPSSSTTSPPATTTAPTKTTSTTTTSTCVLTPTSSVCASALPQACTTLAQKNGTALAAAIPDCISSLGIAYTGDAVTCVFKCITDPSPKIVNCLGNVVLSRCIFALPKECLALAGTTGQAVATQYESCLSALGPFAVRNSANCLIKGVSQGDDVLNCLVTTLGLPGPNKAPGSCDPPPPSKACTTRDNLPKSCRKLAGLKGIASTVAAAQCAASLGPYAFNRFGSCFNVGNISSLDGDNILSCVIDQLTGLCITTLPPSCSALIGLNPDLAREKVKQCLDDVGPFATDATQKCYDTVPLPDGRKIYDCLNGVFFNGRIPPAKH
ncbi:hypothetical protein NLG97_g1760 [Lecanicillium saksenae]|uniref:Uncharacterized protein n=1 Tax=Lecanicillium saksenae TaxID=468837 RepID=A0ACC1R3I3_9HYPO|nr:hypothetical protein NLG97_g1760 [Lecanicillium saksenae]